jgi:CubicO group peptidase (beta-lactamase class C family)
MTRRDALTLTAMAGLSTFLDRFSGSKTEPGLADLAAAIGKALADRRIPGAAVAVVRNGSVLFERGFGVADLEQGTPVTPDTVFELASLTKPMTATAVMMLADRGKLSLDDGISKFVEGAPESWKDITVRRLLTHTSGLGPSAIVQWEGSPLLVATRKQQLDAILRNTPVAPSGTMGLYSDAGYVLLGAVIEKASGVAYREFMEREIFAPARMTSASVLDRRRVIRGRADVYSLREKEIVKWGRDWQYELPSFFGAFASLRDVVRWEQAFSTGTLVKPSTRDMMWMPEKLANGDNAIVVGKPYGLGWELGEHRGRRVAEHTGASGTTLLKFIDDDLTVVVLSNLDVPSGSRPAILARTVAGEIDKRLLPVHRQPPQPDRDPELTAIVRQLVADLAAGRAPAVLTEAARRHDSRLPPPARQSTAELASRIREVAFIAADAAPSNLALAEPISRIVHYKGVLDRGTVYFSFWVTADKRIARLSLYLE